MGWKSASDSLFPSVFLPFLFHLHGGFGDVYDEVAVFLQFADHVDVIDAGGIVISTVFYVGDMLLTQAVTTKVYFILGGGNGPCWMSCGQ